MKKTGSRAKYIFLLLIVVLLVFSWVCRVQILIQAGRYLAPAANGQADVVIIAGNQFVKEKAARVGHELFLSGSAKKMIIVVIHKGAEEETPFGLRGYEGFVSKNLEKLGVKKEQYLIFGTPNEHPITLREAETVMNGLAGEKIGTALLLVEGFHMRRSYWAYQRVGKKYGIKIIPHPLFIKYQSDSWWKKSWGIRDFVSESVKLFYYVVVGYIPPRSLVTMN